MGAIRDRTWYVLVAVALLLAMFGLSDVIIGATSDPGIALAIAGIDPEALRTSSPDGFRLYDFATRGLGLALLLFGLLYLVLLLRPYRQGQPWAWGAAWLLPAWAIAVPILYFAYGVQAEQPPAPPMVSGPIIGVLTAAVLVLDRRRFTRPG